MHRAIDMEEIPSVHVSQETAPKSLKQGKPEDVELEELGQKIGEDWKKLGRRLGVTDAKLQEINQVHGQLSEKGYHTLKHWKQEKGSAATYQALCDALTHELVLRQDLAEKFCYGPSAIQLPAGPVLEERETREATGATASTCDGGVSRKDQEDLKVGSGMKQKWSEPYPKRVKKLHLKLRTDVETMKPAEHNTEDRTPDSALESGESQSGVYKEGSEVLQAPNRILTNEEILHSIALNYLQTIPPRCKDEHDDFITYMKKMQLIVAGAGLGSVQSEIRVQGPRAEAVFQKALQSGSVQVFRGRIMLLGQDRAGKTSLKKCLLDIPFDPDEESTVGIKVDPCKCEVEVDHVKNWQCIEQTKLDVSECYEDIAKLVAKKLKETEGEQRWNTDGSEVDSWLQIKSSNSNPQKSMQPDQDIQLSIDATAVLPDHVMEKVVQYLQGSRLEDDIKAKEVIVSVWDFAGQHLYYTSHSVFLSPRAVYVLVYNLSKDLSAKAEPYARQGTVDIVLENPTNQSNLDNILSWLVSLHCIRPTTDKTSSDQKGNTTYLRPPVFIVGTHADKPFEDIREMEKCIKKSILGKTYEKHVIRPFFAVDNTGSLGEYGVQALQNKIMEVLKQEPYMGEEIPIRWFNFEKVIEALVAKGIYHMDLDQLLTVTKQVCRINDEEELSTMLNFYHGLGVIVKHGRTVVLQAQWLIDLFKQLITVRPFDEMNPLYSECWQELEESGILRMSLVDHVFADFTEKGLSKLDILKMMELYGLIAQFSFLPEDGEHEQSYFVPAQLTSSPSDLCEIKPSGCDPCPLYVHFIDGFVPHGLFPQLLSRCIGWSECSPKRAPNLYQNGARLLIGRQSFFDLILICRKRFIKVVLKRRPASALPSAEMAGEVRLFLDDTLQVMSRELSWLRNLRYKLCVACTYCLKRTNRCTRHRSVCCADDDCLHLLPLLPEQQMICPMNFGDEPMKICGLEKWLPAHVTESEEPEMASWNTEVAVKGGTPENNDLEGLAKEVVAEWKSLGRRLLENDEAELDAIDEENKKCSEKAYKMLLKWKQTKGSGATFRVLHDALCHHLVNRQDLAEKLCL